MCVCVEERREEKTGIFNGGVLREGIAEVEIIQWFKREGDAVEEFDALCEVQSDKANVTITSPFSGVITKLHYKQGEVAKTGFPLIDVKIDGVAPDAAPAVADAAVAKEKEKEEEEEDETTETHGQSNDKVLATPSVRRLAREHKLDLSAVKASGRDGRILKGDVLEYLASRGTNVGSQQQERRAQTLPPPPPPPPPPAATPIPPPLSSPSPSAASSKTFSPLPVSLPIPVDRVEPVRGIRKAMIKSMTPAASVPWFGYADEVVMDRLMETRMSLKKGAEQRGIKLTYMPLILKATALALSEYPVLNSSFVGEEVRYHGAINLGVAIDTPAGLMVPNIKGCAQRSVLEIAHELARLSALAQQNKLSPEDLKGGTFTISNIGNIGGTYMSPVPMPSEIAIGAIGRIRKLPRFNESGQVVARHLMAVSWVADHRIIDGATVARFSEQWRQYLEDPISMLSMLR